MKSSEYWEGRIAKKNWNTYNNLEKKNELLKEFYEESILDLEDEIHKVLIKLGNNPMLSDLHKYNRLTDLKKNMNNILKGLTKKVEKHSIGQFKDAFNSGYKNTMKGLDEIDFALPNQKLIEKLLEYPWSGETFSERLWENTRVLANNLNEVLVRGLVQGKSITEMTQELENRMYKGLNNSHRLVRTETMHYLNESAKQAYTDAGVDEMQIWAAEDERTCKVCGKLHKKVFKSNKLPILPIHPNCRCTYIPIVDTESNQKTPNKVSSWGEFKQQEKQFTSKKEISAYLKNEHNLKFSDSKKHPIDKEILGSCATWLDKFHSYFEGFKKIDPVELPAFKVKAGINSVGYYRYYTGKPEAIELVLNGSFFTDKKYNQDYIDKCINSEWTVANAKPHKTFVHEYGHHMANSLKWLEGGKNKNWCKDFIDNVIIDYNKKYDDNIEFKDIAKLVSRYGATSPDEAFAETFAEYFGGDNPRNFAKVFGEKVEKLINENIKKRSG